MKKLYRSYSLLIAAFPMMNAIASIPIIDFEKPSSYKAISVYDTWEQSPFRTGILEGNVLVSTNPDKLTKDPTTGMVLNSSEKVLGAQRSRFGSNTFGVRVDLPQSFELTPNTQYVHVKVLKPQSGRVMLVGLGSRKERLGQNPYTEQFWVLSSTPVVSGQWCDAVFPIKGAGGIDVRSLVLVPDCESPHDMSEDFLFYIDDIEINDSNKSRTHADHTYTINGNKKYTLIEHPTYHTQSVNLTSPSDGAQTIEIPQQTDRRLYFDETTSIFTARPGEVIKPDIKFVGEKMNGYVYVDWNNDGFFSSEITDNATPAAGSEIMAYSYLGGKNSRGEKRFDIYSMDIPEFKIPKDIIPGIYRIRFKTDRNSNDPRGNIANSSKITDLGGAIIDATLLIHGESVEVNDYQLNGEVLGPDHQKLNAYEHKFGEPLKVYIKPEKGFHQGGMTVRCGYDLKEENAIDHNGNVRYKTLLVTPDQIAKDGSFVIPSEYTRGNVYILGNMIENRRNKK